MRWQHYTDATYGVLQDAVDEDCRIRYKFDHLVYWVVDSVPTSGSFIHSRNIWKVSAFVIRLGPLGIYHSSYKSYDNICIDPMFDFEE